VLLLFGVMLTSRMVRVDMKTGTVHPVPAMILAAVLAGTLSGLLYSTFRTAAAPSAGLETTTRTLGEMLMTTYVLPFEIASVVLIVAMIGAALTARRGQRA
jgi:NADH-quinone oxidoreductase subunit J